MLPFVAVFLTDPPDWVPDEVCSYCTACKAPFTVIRRKHHCRSCGKVMTQSNMWGSTHQREQQIHVDHRNSAAQQNVHAQPGFSVRRCFCVPWLPTLSLRLQRVGEGFDFYTAISCVKLKAEFPVEILEHSPPQHRVTLDYCCKLWWARAACTARGDAHTAELQGQCVPLLSFQTFAGSLWCVGLLLCKFVGEEEGAREKKSSHVPQEARNLQSYFTCWLVCQLKRKRVEKLLLLTM